MNTHLAGPDPECSRNTAPWKGTRIGEPKLLSRMQNRHPFYRRFNAFHAQRLLRLIIDKKIHRLLIRRNRASTEEMIVIQSFFCSKYRLLVVMNPSAEIQQHLLLTLIERSVLFRSDVQQHSSAEGNTVTEHAHNLTAALVIIVRWTISPGIIDRRTEFPLAFRSVQRDSLLRCLIISIALHSRIQYNVRIQGMQIFPEFRHLPLCRAPFPVTIKP